MPEQIETPQTQPAQQAGLSESATCGLAYVTFVPAIIFLATAPYNQNPKVKFHSWQSIFLGIAMFAVDMVLSFIPVVGWLLIPLVMLGFLLVWIMCMLKAYKGDRFKLPVIGNFAEQQAGQ